MNWKEINKNNPCAFKAWANYEGFEIKGELKLQLIMTLTNNEKVWMNRRDLYDFFDSKGIYAGVIAKNKKDFKAFIYASPKQSWTKEGFSNREAAESKLFTEAFSMLEQKLKEEINNK